MIGLPCWLNGVGWCDKGPKKMRTTMNRGELNWVYTHIVNICTITPNIKVMLEHLRGSTNFREAVESTSITQKVLNKTKKRGIL